MFKKITIFGNIHLKDISKIKPINKGRRILIEILRHVVDCHDEIDRLKALVLSQHKPTGKKITAAAIEAEFITVTEMAAESGQKLATIYNWLRFHHYLTYERVLGKTLVRRDDWEEFKRTHPHLMIAGE